MRLDKANTYNSFTEEVGFSAIASIKEIAMNNSRLSISLYVRGTEIETTDLEQIEESVTMWNTSSCSALEEYAALSNMILEGNNIHAL